jgi:O-acetylserine/cysteine efflux transporter
MPAARLPPRDLAAVLVVVLLWGLNVVAGKEALAAMPPFLVMTIRFAVVAAVLAPVLRAPPRQLPDLALVAAVTGVGHFGLLFFGLEGVDAGTASVLVQLGAPFSVALAWLVFGDRPDGRTALGLGLAFGGVVLLAGGASAGQVGPMLIIVLAMAMWAVSNLLVKRLGSIAPLALTGWVSLLAAPWVLGLTVLFEHGQVAAVRAAPWTAWGGIAFTSLGSSIVAYTLWYGLLARHPVSRIAPFTLLGPVVGFAAGAVALGETVTLLKVAGGVLTVAGVAIIELRPGRAP